MAHSATTRPRARPVVEKREAILSAALRLIARLGLHNTPVSAVAREAGVAAGTLYLYFPSKEAMINALYLGVLADRDRVLIGSAPTTAALPDESLERMWERWRALARWHLDHEDASNLILQCRASGILSEETRAIEQARDAEGQMMFRDAIEQGLLRDLSRYVFWALFVGPIFILVQMRDSGEIDVTDDVLRTTFDGVCRSVLP
ncbi:MAG: TetR/AcrR family transcriptional regulator [bacterium]